MQKIYFLAPTRDSPPSGPIVLGNIVKSPRTPGAAVNNRDSETLRRLVGSRKSVEEKAATRNVSSHTSLASGVWAKFLAFADLGAGAQAESGEAASYEICTLTSLSITPELADIKAIFAEPEVQASLRSSLFSSNLYMITGVQIASGTKYKLTAAKSHGLHLHSSSNLAPLGAPVTAGAGGQTVGRSSQVAEGSIQDEFVFSYRLREILYKRKAVNEVRECRNGDLFSKDGDRRENNQAVAEAKGSPPEYGEAEVLHLKHEDPDLPEMWELDVERAPRDKDGDEVLCVHMSEDDEDL